MYMLLEYQKQDTRINGKCGIKKVVANRLIISIYRVSMLFVSFARFVLLCLGAVVYRQTDGWSGVPVAGGVSVLSSLRCCKRQDTTPPPLLLGEERIATIDTAPRHTIP